MNIPIMDLKAQYRPLAGKIEKTVGRLLRDQACILGKEVEALEKAIASYCGTAYAVGLNSGTDALILALDAMGIGRGDEVITTPFTFVATGEAIARSGARPVFVDIDPLAYTIDPKRIGKRITKRTKAIMPVHLFGLCADMDPIRRIAGKHGLKVIEDSAQAIGSEYKGRRAGSMGDAAAISFFPSKHLGCCGDGGMVVTNRSGIYQRIRLLRDHGSSKKYRHDIIGYNSRLDNVQAAILSIKLASLEAWLARRIAIARYYSRELEGYPVRVPFTPEGYRHTYHLYVVKTEKRCAGKLAEYLGKHGIEARQYYRVPLHLQKCFGSLGYRKGSLPYTEEASGTTLALPVYPELKANQIRYIVATVKSFFDGKKR
jgi:dTDP-4-amino-4,6-dideoxygalactose transaminase